MNNYTPKNIPNSRGKRIAIGDIHGCFHAFEALLNKQLKINKDDQIFILGDLIDKGNNSALVLDLIIDLKANDYQIFPIKGNHEKKFLTAYSCGFEFFEAYLKAYNSLDLLEGELDQYLQLISGFEYYIELDNFVLSHIGINEDRINPFTDLRGMFPEIQFDFDAQRIMQKTQIHGHMVRTIEEIKSSIEKKEKRFSIDSGCYLKEDRLGYLTAIDLDTMELFHQINR